MVRHALAGVLRPAAEQRVRVIVPGVGGGYGSKSYTKIEPLTAARVPGKCARQVKIAAERRGSFLTTRASMTRVYIRSTAVDRAWQS